LPEGSSTVKVAGVVISKRMRSSPRGRYVTISLSDHTGIFEASLYKHWTDEFSSRRVLLSFGFVLPYDALGRKSDEPRVRLSQRIEKYFQA
jgi:hypothetical protein